MSDNEDSNNNNNNNNNSWLGFSLSPHMKMEVSSSDHPYNQHHSLHSASNPFYLSPHFNNNNTEIFYGIPDNSSLHHHSAAASLSVMPLKSDGSLCIMEALSRSQTEGSFFGFLYIYACVFCLSFFVCGFSQVFVFDRDGAEFFTET